jgi:hypothetical protein
VYGLAIVMASASLSPGLFPLPQRLITAKSGDVLATGTNEVNV